MNCKNCGNKIVVNDMFCTNCGNKLHENNLIHNKIETQNNKTDFRLSVISFVMYAVILLILIGIILWLYIAKPSAGAGWVLIIAFFVTLCPLLISLVMGIIAINSYRKNKSPKRKIEKIFYVLNWITLVTISMLMLSPIIIQIFLLFSYML